MRLPVFKLLQKATTLLWQKRARMARTLFPTISALLILDIISVQRTGNITDVPKLVEVLNTGTDVALTPALLLLKGILFTLFAVTCHRLILLGDNSVPSFGLHSWAMRETKFLGRTIYFYFLSILVTVLVVHSMFYFLHIIAPIAARYSISTLSGVEIPWFVTVLPGAYIFSRFSMLLPATAVDHVHSIKWAWKATSGNGLRMFILAWMFPMILRGFLYNIFLKRSPLDGVIVSLLFYISIIIAMIALSLSYALLAGNNTGCRSLDSFSLDQPLRFGTTATD